VSAVFLDVHMYVMLEEWEKFQVFAELCSHDSGYNHNCLVRLEIFMVMKIQVVVFWVMMWQDTGVLEGHAVSIFRVKRWRQHGQLECWYHITSFHSVITLKMEVAWPFKMLVSLHSVLTQKMEAAWPFKMLVSFHIIT
jgi:hypothetical protein